MKPQYTKGLLCALILYLCILYTAKSQSVNQDSAISGIWQDYGTALSHSEYPEFKGRLVNVSWSDIETAPDSWDWSVFDTDVNQHTADNLPVIILVYTGPDAPDWLYSVGGVPKVNAMDDDGNIVAYSPYYLDSNYNNYFKRMITTVRQHIQNYPSSTRNLIIGMQGCYGSTGDQIAYKGNVAPQYQISSFQFDSLFKVYSLYYYNQYKDLVPPIRLLSNASVTDSSETYWLMDNCPGGWIKCGSFAKGSQINMESDKNEWLYRILNEPQNGEFVLARSEIVGSQLNAGWWLKDSYKQMFGIMCYCIYWGLDWPNETANIISDPNYDSSFAFFNKYAGQKVPGLATNALCALKDALDASDSIRFPSSIYGPVIQTAPRYTNIYNDYSSYGAKLEDVSAVLGNDLGCLTANGINDVGWHLLPGNYERYLHQINANATSAGYWNVDDADNTVMYGRYARGFDLAKGKNALYFDLDDNFLKNAPLDGAYPVTIEITYFDSAYGSWQLFYDAVGNNNKASIKANCTNSNKWVKARVTLTDANFGNSSISNSDFYIQSTGTQNVIFSIVELSRNQPLDSGFSTTALASFDTVCINSTIPPHSFVLLATVLDGTDVQIGPFNGYSFSTSATGAFSDSLVVSNYGNTINQTIYIQINTSDEGNYSGNIPITGGGVTNAQVGVTGVVFNSSPTLNAVITNVTCYNNKDGMIDLQPTGGTGPFTYTWTNDIQQFWDDSTQDIDSLRPANYTVVVNSGFGCSASKTFVVTQPDQLVVSVTQDSAIFCKDGTTTVTVSAIGGTLPYTGTGSFVADHGFTSYPVTDANGCKDQQGLTVENGIHTAPDKPNIGGPSKVTQQQTDVVFLIENANTDYTYVWTVPDDAKIVSGQNTAQIVVNWGSNDGNVTAIAINTCGESPTASQNVSIGGSGGIFGTIGGVLHLQANTTANSNEISLAPNPVSSIATLSFDAKENYRYTVEIFDINGKQLLVQDGNAVPGTNIVKLNVSRFAAGTYFIKILSKEIEAKTIKMIKQ